MEHWSMERSDGTTAEVSDAVVALHDAAGHYRANSSRDRLDCSEVDEAAGDGVRVHAADTFHDAEDGEDDDTQDHGEEDAAVVARLDREMEERDEDDDVHDGEEWDWVQNLRHWDLLAGDNPPMASFVRALVHYCGHLERIEQRRLVWEADEEVS
mmetsp:Transcript_23645/g.50071  ORF Transcript_23645/g.50071 Transcript_23645/m.50071 type:complete len:155 (-) Transcript_23645:3825-4289(-)